jgi:Tfp pilus assembly protein FimV
MFRQMCNTSRIAFRHVIPIRSVKPSPTLLLCLLPASIPAFAAGLGELTVNSRIGEPLQAEVRIIAEPDEKLEAFCFSLAVIKDAELPVIASARLQLEQGSDGTLLRISAMEALLEPLAMLRLRAGCGVELQRDYIVMPLLPDSQEASAAAASRPIRTTAPPVLSETREMETAPRPAPPPRPPAPPKPPPPEPTERGDRLVLGNAPMQLDYNLPPSIIEETEARLFRMETSLSRLNESLQKLEGAIAIGSEIRAVEQELQMATAIQQAPAPAAGPAASASPAPEAAPAPAASTDWLQWLQLLGGALLGGALTALALNKLGRLIPGYRRQ